MPARGMDVSVDLVQAYRISLDHRFASIIEWAFQQFASQLAGPGCIELCNRRERLILIRPLSFCRYTPPSHISMGLQNVDWLFS